MKYHVYSIEKGCEMFAELEAAARYFKELPEESQYTSLGVTEDYQAVDLVIRGRYTGNKGLQASMDIKSSPIFEKNPREMMDVLRSVYKEVGISNEKGNRVIKQLKVLENEMDEELEV